MPLPDADILMGTRYVLRIQSFSQQSKSLPGKEEIFRSTNGTGAQGHEEHEVHEVQSTLLGCVQAKPHIPRVPESSLCDQEFLLSLLHIIIITTNCWTL